MTNGIFPVLYMLFFVVFIFGLRRGNHLLKRGTGIKILVITGLLLIYLGGISFFNFIIHVLLQESFVTFNWREVAILALSTLLFLIMMNLLMRLKFFKKQTTQIPSSGALKFLCSEITGDIQNNIRQREDWLNFRIHMILSSLEEKHYRINSEIIKIDEDFIKNDFDRVKDLYKHYLSTQIDYALIGAEQKFHDEKSYQMFLERCKYFSFATCQITSDNLDDPVTFSTFCAGVFGYADYYLVNLNDNRAIARILSFQNFKTE